MPAYPPSKRSPALLACLGLALACLLPALMSRASDDGIQVVARVGDDIITSEDVAEALQPVSDAMTPEERASPEGLQKLADARKNVLENMVDQQLILLAAKDGPEGYADAAKDNKSLKNPYLPDDADVETEMEKVFDQSRERFPDEDSFEAALAQEHLSVPEYRDRLRQRVRDEMTVDRMQKIKEEEFRPSLRVSDAEALAFYQQNQSDFFQGAEVELRHILFPADEEARAKRFLDVLKAKPAASRRQAFIDLARRYSADAPTKDQGGLLGWIQKGQSWPELEAVAFAAPADSLAGPVKTSAGWHILYIEGHRSGRQLPFDSVKKDVENMVYQQKVHDRMQEWIGDLKTQYYVELKEGSGQ